MLRSVVEWDRGGCFPRSEAGDLSLDFAGNWFCYIVLV